MAQAIIQREANISTKRSLSHSTILVLISSVVSQASVAATYLIVARSEGPAEFGRVMALVSLILSAVGLLEFGTSTLLTREIASNRMTLRQAAHGLFSRMLVMLGVAAFIAVGLLALRRASPAEAMMLALLAMSMTLSTGLQGVIRGLGKVQAASWLGATDKCVGFLVVAIDLVWRHNASGLSLMLGLTLGPAVVSMYILGWLLLRVPPSPVRWVHPYKGAFSFGLTSAVTSVQTLDTTAIASLAGTEAAGQFGAVSRWVGPLNLIVAAFTQAAFPALAADVSSAIAFKRLMSGAWILGLSWAAALLTALLSPWLVDLLLGSEYRHSAPVLSLMALATVPAAISQVTLMLLQARGDERRAAGRITAAVVLQLLMVSLGSVLFGSLGAAGAILLTQALLAAVLGKQVRRLLREENRFAQEVDHDAAPAR